MIDRPHSPQIVFIRHGETDWNAEARLQGQRDIALNEKGIDQARQTGKILSSFLGPAGLADKNRHWVSSPLSRATQTMELAREVAGLPPKKYSLDRRLKELTFGEWEGLTWPEVKAVAPYAANWREGDKWNFVPPGGESYQMLSDRLWPWIRSLTGATVVSAHGGIARVLLAELAGMDRQSAALASIWQGRILVLADGRFDWIG